MPVSLCCPACHGPLTAVNHALRCTACPREFAVVDGVPDFMGDAVMAADDANQAWLRPEVVAARQTVYDACARELRGMAFCVAEIARRSFAGCRVLEVGAGTGHFTRRLAEACAPGTEIFAFDASWPMLNLACAAVAGAPGVTLFRADARGPLPFAPESLDIVFMRLAPLGPRGTPNVLTAHALLRPGGWCFEARWRRDPTLTTSTEWATQHGYAEADSYEWRYRRLRSEEEFVAALVDRPRQPYEVIDLAKARAHAATLTVQENSVEGIPVWMDESLLIARK